MNTEGDQAVQCDGRFAAEGGTSQMRKWVSARGQQIGDGHRIGTPRATLEMTVPTNTNR
jgi:hypothetical protein